MTMGVINAVAQFERDILIERTQAGLSKAKSIGKALERPKALSETQIKKVLKKLNERKSFETVQKFV